MKTKANRAIWLLLSISMVMLLFGCVSAPSLPAIPSATSTQLPSATPSPLSSHTISLPSATPTLSVEHTYQNLLALLQDTQCTLPCLMGIVPSVYTTIDVHDALLPFKTLTDWGSLPIDSEGGLSIEYPSGDMPIILDFFYFPSEEIHGMLDHIYLNTKVANSNGPMDDPKLYKSTSYVELLRRYSLPVILSDFGRPSEVLISATPSTGAEPGVSGFFDLRLAYPNKGFYISYFSLIQEKDNIYRACPTDSFVSIWAEAPTSSMSLEDIIVKMNNWPGIMSFIKFKPLDEATGMTADRFFQVFNKPTNDCLETPKSIWVKP
jgi:hypothetical protein